MITNQETNNCKSGEVLYALLRIMEIRDASLFSHAVNTAEISLQFGTDIGLNAADMTNLRYGALLHDIGMLAMPDFISFKPASLSSDEWIIIRQHPEYGVSMVSQLAFMAEALQIIENHQECWNGSGYPNGKRGEEIPFLARIVTITNTYDALTADKIYRPGHSKTDALAIMGTEAGKIFDPDLLAKFSAMMVEKKMAPWTMDALFGLEQEGLDQGGQ